MGHQRADILTRELLNMPAAVIILCKPCLTHRESTVTVWQAVLMASLPFCSCNLAYLQELKHLMHHQPHAMYTIIVQQSFPSIAKLNTFLPPGAVHAHQTKLQ